MKLENFFIYQQDTKKKVSNRYQNDVYAKDTQELKLSIPHVLFE